MPDDFFATNDGDQPQKVKIGDKEYTQEELDKMAQIASQVDEVEKRFNTKIDRLMPEYTKSQQKLKATEEEREKLRKDLEEIQKKQETGGDLTPQQREQAKRAIFDLMGVEEPPMTKKQLESWYQERRAGEKLVDELVKLQGEVDGSDGRPKFQPEEIAKHMDETGIKNPMKAYKDKYEKELEEWKQKQLKSDAPDDFVTDTKGGGGQKQPQPPKLTRDTLQTAVREALYQKQ